jgi:hypothetical protein
MPDYNRLEKLLYRGFLTTEVDVAGVPIVLKTVNQSEYELIDLQSYSEEEGWKRQASFFLAYSTLFFNHESILPERRKHVPTLAEIYMSLPDRVLIALLTCADNINRRAASCLRMVEGYSYGPQSRQSWYMLKGNSPCDPRCTGFEGTEHMGVNMHQRLWVYFNTMEDAEEEYLQRYQLAKFSVSPHAPKQIKEMDQSDRKQMKQREKRREALYEGRDPGLVTTNNQIRITNETAEELLDQMERANREEKDFHDWIIEQHQKKVRDAYLKQKHEQEERRRKAVERRDSKGHEEPRVVREGYSEDEIADYLDMTDYERRKRLRDSEEQPSVEEREAALLRWGFIDEEDVPADRRPTQPEEEPSTENPLIREHYERVSDDLNQMRPSYPRSEWDDES